MNNTQTDFTWKRQPSGQYVARHGFWVYTAWRNADAAKGRQWVLEGYPEGNPDAAQARTGFSNAKGARLAAERTHCFVCGRAFPFGTLKLQATARRSQLSYPTWQCRDEGPCYAERKRITAVGYADEYASALAEIRDLKAKVRRLEVGAYNLRVRALASGMTSGEDIDRIERESIGLPVRSAEEIQRDLT